MTRDGLMSDEALYAWLGQVIFHHPAALFSKEVIQYHPPLFSLSLAIGNIFLSSRQVLEMIPGIFYIWGIIAMYILGCRLKSSFVGLLAAIILGFNIYFFHCSIYVLADAPLMVLLIHFAITLLNINNTQDRWRHGKVWMWGTAVILMKWSGIIILPWMIIYYLWGRAAIPWKQRWQELILPLVGLAVTISLLLLNHFWQWGYLLPPVPAFNFHYVDNVWFRLNDILKLIQVQDLLICMAMGIIFLLWQSKSTQVFLLSWLFVFTLGLLMSSLDREESRYILILLPCFVLFAVLGLEYIVQFLEQFAPTRMKKFIAPVFIFLLIEILFVNSRFSQLLTERYLTNYEQVGNYVKTLDTGEALIIAGSERQMRYYTGVDFVEFKGRILPFRQEKQELESLLTLNQNRDIILVTDNFEPLQPAWAFPLNDQAEMYLEKLGFNRQSIFYRQFFSKNSQLQVDKGFVVYLKERK